MSTQKHGNNSFDARRGQYHRRLLTGLEPRIKYTQSKVSLSRPDQLSVDVSYWITCCYTQELDKTRALVQHMSDVST